MLERFKNAVAETAQHKMEIRLITIASLFAAPATVFMLYVAGHLFGLIEW
jgi:hypothetical protein